METVIDMFRKLGLHQVLVTQNGWVASWDVAALKLRTFVTRTSYGLSWARACVPDRTEIFSVCGGNWPDIEKGARSYGGSEYQLTGPNLIILNAEMYTLSSTHNCLQLCVLLQRYKCTQLRHSIPPAWRQCLLKTVWRHCHPMYFMQTDLSYDHSLDELGVGTSCETLAKMHDKKNVVCSDLWHSLGMINDLSYSNLIRGKWRQPSDVILSTVVNAAML